MAVWLVLSYVAVFGLTTLQDQWGGATAIAYTEFSDQVDTHNVKEVFAKGDTIEGRLKSGQPVPASEQDTYTVFTTERPTFAEDDLLAELDAGGATVRATPVVEERGAVWNLLISLGPVLLLIGFYFWMFKRQAGGAPGLRIPFCVAIPPRPFVSSDCDS